MSTAYHAKYFAHELSRKRGSEGVDRLSAALFDASVDLNPHQIEAALFALRSPLSKGVILADEVGLGKTIEAGLVLCQYWAERKRRLLVICPASLRKQWSLELSEKFNLPNIVLDARAYRQAQLEGNPNPFSSECVIITSIHFASAHRGELRTVAFDLAVIDEAHKLRNAYRPSNKTGQNIRWALEDRKKLLLTATPLQNSLLELYGLSTVIDDKIFGDLSSFRSQFTHSRADLNTLRERLKPFCKRTLRSQVVEYVKYTERLPITVRFRPTDDEQRLYEAVSEYLSREDTFALPRRQKHLTALILRKLLASSSHAVADTLEKLRERLEQLCEGEDVSDEWAEEWIEDDEMEGDLLDEILDGTLDEGDDADGETLDRQALENEILELTRFTKWARSIGVDSKSKALVKALDTGLDRMAQMGANRKALVFTESRRTQEYLKRYLEGNGYGGQVVSFNGSNSDPDSREIINRWIESNQGSGRVTGSRVVDSRTALIEHFRDQATIMIATEAAAEGVNLQFCSLVINYDLPWNPQRIEQRIGRCHRYGQKHDVVVINFLNERNAADQRVYELLSEKFNLFNGVFGSSDEILGSIESGVDFERRIFAIYQQCRTPEAIEAAFQALQHEMEETIQGRLADTRQILMEHFDEDVHSRLKMRLDDAQASLDRVGRMFWALTHQVLGDYADFDDVNLTFLLRISPDQGHKLGRYHLISKDRPNVHGDFLYRLSHPLGEWVLEAGKQCSTPEASVRFDVTNYPLRLSMVEVLKGESGWLTLQHLVIDSFDREEHLLFSAVTDQGNSLDQETCERMFHCDASGEPLFEVDPGAASRLAQEAKRHADAVVARSMETNNQLFHEERERLERWAEDMVLAAEKDLRDTKEQIKSLRRQARLATTLDDQNEIQLKIRELERKQRRQRQQIFDVEDEIADKRDQLIDALQRRMSQKVSTTPLFTIRWEVV